MNVFFLPKNVNRLILVLIKMFPSELFLLLLVYLFFAGYGTRILLGC